MPFQIADISCMLQSSAIASATVLVTTAESYDDSEIDYIERKHRSRERRLDKTPEHTKQTT